MVNSMEVKIEIYVKEMKHSPELRPIFSACIASPASSEKGSQCKFVHR